MSDLLQVTEHTGIARYDGWADWYDEYLTGPFYEHVRENLAHLIGSGRGFCLDIGCGTGIHLPLFRSLGWSAIGVDISSDQLRVARSRSSTIAQADVASLPFPSGRFRRCVSVLTLTDFDDVGPFFMEAARVLEPQGQLAVVAMHPCFLGPFAIQESGATGVVKIYPGYCETQRVFEGPGLGQGLRSKVGVRHVPLAEMLNKLLSAGFQLSRVEEVGGGSVPQLLTLVAFKL